MSPVRCSLTTLALLLASSPCLLSQTQTTGAIIGTVKDEAGKPLVGAQVRVTSAQIQRSATTDATGSFRFPLLNVGEWRLEASMSGAQTVVAKLPVAPQVTTPVNLTLRLFPRAEVTVVANATVVGVDSTTTNTGKTLNADIVQALPTGCYSTGIAYLAPGTSDSGFGAPAIGGGSGPENTYIVDGLNTTDMRWGYQGTVLPKEFIEQTDVQTGGFAPEFSALGGVINAVTKQGSNQFEGSISYIQNLPNAQAYDSYNPVIGQVRSGLPQQWREIVATVGGPLIKDKLFYFFGLSYVKFDADPSKVSYNLLGLRGVPTEPKEFNPYLKLNYYPHTDHQLSLTVNRRRTENGMLKAYPVLGDAELGTRTQNSTNTINVVHDWQIASNMYFSTKYGKTTFARLNVANNPSPLVTDQNYYYAGPGKDHVPDGVDPLYESFVTGGTGFAWDQNDSTSEQLRMDFSWFLGDHYLKTGVSRKRDRFVRADHVPQSYDNARLLMHRTSTYGPLGTFRGVQLEYFSINGLAQRNEDAFYIQDLWEFSAGFKLRYGFRYEGQEVITPTGQTFMRFSRAKDVLQPRIGLTWDPTGDNSQKVSASYAEYYEAIPMVPAMRSGGTEVHRRWNYSPNQSTYNPATGHWTYFGQPDGIPGVDRGLGYVEPGGAIPTAIIEDLKLPTRREVILGYEKQLKSGWKLGANLRWRRMFNPIEDSVPTDRDGNPADPEAFWGEWVGIMWNPKAGKTYTWTSQLSGQKISWTNDVFPTAYNDYKALELSVEQRTDRWYFSGSYTWSRLYGTYEGLASYSVRNDDANINPTWDYWPYVGEGLLPLDRTHAIKAMGVYTLPAFGQEFQFAGVLNARSGLRSTIFTGGDELDLGGYGANTVLDGKYGSGKQAPWFVNLDLTISYRHRLSKRTVITPSLDIFNVFNKRTALGYHNLLWDEDYPKPGPNPFYGQPTSFQGGRSMQLTVRIEF